MNIKGDSVVITYVPTDKALCSNGYAYNYEAFEIPDSLYQGGTKMEGEDLVKPVGLNKFAWNDSVIVETSEPMPLSQELIQGASNDSIIRVSFPKGHKETYSIEFNSPKLFPRKYQMVIGTHMDIGGLYNIYVNDELMTTFDYYQFILYRGVLFSVTGERFIPRGRFNRFDLWVDNLEEYGNAKIKIEYVGPSFVASNGLVIDYIDFIPAAE